MSNNEQLKPLSLYVHFPWCIQKCPYCDFNSHTIKHDLPEERYVNRLLEELEDYRALLSTRRINTVFFGGGTPSLFSGNSIQRILQTLHQQYHLSPTAEITLEANPGTTDSARFIDFIVAGVNRLSIGTQSFDNAMLKKLGRIHDQQQACNAFQQAREAGFDNINIDLMFALPDQNQAQALNDLQQAIELQPEHLSWYQLTIEPHTHFYQFPPTLPIDDQVHRMHQAGIDLLQQGGYQQYEVSAFCQPNKPCEHNLNYWQFGDYLGIGAGAHSKLSIDHSIHRQWNVKHPKSYLNPDQPMVAGRKTVASQDLVFEFFMNRLRLNKPISETEFHAATGKHFNDIHNTLNQLQQQSLLQHDTAIRLTPLGRNFLNDVLSAWL